VSGPHICKSDAVSTFCSDVVVVVVVVVVLFNPVVERPNSTIEQDNSKPQNKNRWIKNVRIERILYIQERNKQFMNVQIGNGTESRR